MSIATIRELFHYNDWGRDKVLSAAAGLGDAELDRSFEMGSGSLRKTLQHLWAAERVWLDRWIAAGWAKLVEPEAGLPIATLWDRFRRTAGERDAFVSRLDEGGLARTVTYTSQKGEMLTFTHRAMMLHVCNHGTHHRAQAVNMLRHLGAEVPRPGPDYIFMKIEEPTAPALDLQTVKATFAYGDWAQDRLFAAAQGLTDAQLDRPFEMGMGSLRKTLLHIGDAEQWWFDNWTVGGGRPFPALDEKLAVAEVRRRFSQIAEKRSGLLAPMTDAELQRIVEGHPRPNVVRRFPIGVTMLQLCSHGTHHRAQALNMLRRVSVTPPGLDLILWARDTRAI